MIERFVVGKILFCIDSPTQMHLKWEDVEFLYHNQVYDRVVNVRVAFVDHFSHGMSRELYSVDGVSFGETLDGTEVRMYKSSCINRTVEYAMSVRQGNDVSIEFLNEANMWNKPGVRIWTMIHMERFLREADGLVLHCCYLCREGKAILFTAPSGTGKTTQGKLWEKLYGARIINGDKALIQRRNGIWCACGYPFHGSSLECLDQSYPICAIVVVRQSSRDSVEKISLAKSVGLVYSECSVNTWDAGQVSGSIDLAADLCSRVPVVKLNCTMNDEAAHTLMRYLKEQTDGTI